MSTPADCPYCPSGEGNVHVACIDLDQDDQFQVWCETCWAHGPSRDTIVEAVEAWDRVAGFVARGEDDVGPNACFRGNSVGHIHDKMSCYQDQVGMGYDALRALGFDPKASKDNNEMREHLKAWTAEKRTKLDAHPGNADPDHGFSRALSKMSKLEVFSMSTRLKAGMTPMSHEQFEKAAAVVFGENWRDNPDFG